MKEPRHFWILEIKVPSPDVEGHIVAGYHVYDTGPIIGSIEVIEKSAYEELKAENIRLKTILNKMEKTNE